jgi:hypothetical protein
MAHFDDVLSPWSKYSKWEIRITPSGTYSASSTVHLETQIWHCVRAELMVGLALLLSNRYVQAQLAELIRFRETCRAFMIAANRFRYPGSLFKPNNIHIDFGRAYYQHKMVNIMIDFCGRGVSSSRLRKNWIIPTLGLKVAEALRGAEISAGQFARSAVPVHPPSAVPFIGSLRGGRSSLLLDAMAHDTQRERDSNSLTCSVARQSD